MTPPWTATLLDETGTIVRQITAPTAEAARQTLHAALLDKPTVDHPAARCGRDVLYLMAEQIARGGSLSYRIQGGSVVWYLLLHRPDVAFVRAARETAVRVATDTGVPLIYGRPPMRSERGLP